MLCSEEESHMYSEIPLLVRWSENGEKQRSHLIRCTYDCRIWPTRILKVSFTQFPNYLMSFFKCFRSWVLRKRRLTVCRFGVWISNPSTIPAPTFCSVCNLPFFPPHPCRHNPNLLIQRAKYFQMSYINSA